MVEFILSVPVKRAGPVDVEVALEDVVPELVLELIEDEEVVAAMAC